ncbi:acyl carrier protein [Asticcacaulis benevestitus]|uniref:Carrier domain-containing protein n=1 Tax=Asticcacaulis benevestitus DSM 16100 = ATCC BAA-896 TaxID=1121022 RepID=V4P0U3_9CAUL|nr:acyl carrier protein [Asticcacaulis benevestitus]ESQ87592.1 hypothetical protein ABENE_17145 [Asticcacaulis benevestitus DSM 16100 = ATCC BAA-896]
MDPKTYVYDILVEIVAKELNLSESVVREAKTLTELGIDSLEMIEVIMAVEDRLGIVIPDRELREVASINELVALILREGGATIAVAMS